MLQSPIDLSTVLHRFRNDQTTAEELGERTKAPIVHVKKHLQQATAPIKIHDEIFVLSIVVDLKSTLRTKQVQTFNSKGEVAFQKQHNYPINQPITDNTGCQLACVIE